MQRKGDVPGKGVKAIRRRGKNRQMVKRGSRKKQSLGKGNPSMRKLPSGGEREGKDAMVQSAQMGDPFFFCYEGL